VFIRFYRSLDRFRGDASVGTYLTRTAINLSLNEIRRRARGRARDVSSPRVLDNIADPSDRTGSAIDGDTIRNAILQLSPKQRSAVVLRLVKGHSTQETADILKVPVGTVLSRLSRAQKTLQEMLAEFREA
jgi:RNA polymerase sigma-70 factor (ECF subfamily)